MGRKLWNKMVAAVDVAVRDAFYKSWEGPLGKASDSVIFFVLRFYLLI